MIEWIHILFILTSCQALLFFILFGKTVLSPSVIAAVMFSISEFFAILNINKWGFHINDLTVFVIISFLMTMALGESLSIFLQKSDKLSKFDIKNVPIIDISNKKLLIFSVFQFLVLIYYYKSTTQSAYLAGWDGGDMLVAYARQARLDNEYYGNFNRLASWLKNISQAGAFVCAYVYIHRTIFFGKKHLLLIVPIIIYLVNESITGGRATYIYFLSFCLIVGGVFYQRKNNWSIWSNLSIIFYGITSLLIFLILFIVVGSLKNENILYESFHYICIYTGLSIPSLDQYLFTLRPKNLFFGENTLVGIYHFFSKFTNFSDMTYPHLDFVCFNGTCTNVYTIIRRYHQDFGSYGLFIVPFFITLIYRYFFDFVKNNCNFCIISFSILYAPIVMVGIDEQILLNNIDIRTIVILCLTYIMYKKMINTINL